MSLVTLFFITEIRRYSEASKRSRATIVSRVLGELYRTIYNQQQTKILTSSDCDSKQGAAIDTRVPDKDNITRSSPIQYKCRLRGRSSFV